tara:strand:- start:3870 stop:4178 length:309 start_codon:yes stop_codon:yes gene_type:complete
MNIQPNTIALDDDERRVLAAYMGNRGVATRAQVKQMTDVLWRALMADAHDHDAKTTKRKTAGTTRTAAPKRRKAAPKKVAAKRPKATARRKRKNPSEAERWG